MALNFKKWLVEKMGGGSARTAVEDIAGEDFFNLTTGIYVRELAFWSCVSLMGKAVSKCKFKTFSADREIKGAEFYRWNFEPNKNQNSNAFLHKLISKLFSENEALVVEAADAQMLVADSYNHRQYALVDDIFSQVTVGDFQFRRDFYQSEVFYFRLEEKNMRQIINGLYSDYQKLLDYGMKSYQKSRGTKGIIEMDTAARGNEAYNEAIENLQNKGFSNFAKAEDAVLSLYKGMKYTDLGSKTYSNEGTRDIRAMIDDVSDFTARAFGIPPVLLSGQIAGTSDAEDFFLTFAIDPLVDLLQTEINRKLYGSAEIQKGNYLKIDTKAIRHIDIMSAPANIEKWISSGVYSVNDILMMMGEPTINEPWARKHFITKNFSEVEEALNGLKGGEEK